MHSIVFRISNSHLHNHNTTGIYSFTTGYIPTCIHNVSINNVRAIPSTWNGQEIADTPKQNG